MARGGSRAGGRDRGAPSRETTVSKKLSWLLRHGAEKEGLKLGKGGYVSLADVLSNRTIKSLQPRPTLAEIKSIVATNEKQRFSLIHISAASNVDDPALPDPAPGAQPESLSTESSIPPNLNAAVALSDNVDDEDPSHYLIRANQGHSLVIADAADMLTPITSETAPHLVVHGTRRETWPAILHSGGLKPMTRTHVHFATGIPEALQRLFEVSESKSSSDGVAILGLGADDARLDGKDSQSGKGKEDARQVLSGMRNSSTLLIYLDLQKALGAGVKFYLSENRVVLSEGDPENGLVSTQFFQKVVGRGGRVLMQDGKSLDD